MLYTRYQGSSRFLQEDFQDFCILLYINQTPPSRKRRNTAKKEGKVGKSNLKIIHSPANKLKSANSCIIIAGIKMASRYPTPITPTEI